MCCVFLVTRLKTFMTRPAAGAGDKAGAGNTAACNTAAGSNAAASACINVATSSNPRPQLRQWPGKDTVQALAAWWICGTLVESEGHAYTEPELYSTFEELCFFQADYAVIRKELVRRGFMEAPVITANADRTTSTTYRVSRTGLQAALQGEWRTKGVF